MAKKNGGARKERKTRKGDTGRTSSQGRKLSSGGTEE
jgi:hypothetical protein